MKTIHPVTERADYALRFIAPFGFMLMLFILNIVALGPPFSALMKAPLFLSGLYYWAIYRPTIIPPWCAFLAGFFIDILSGLPPGLSAVIFVFVQKMVSDQRYFLINQPYLMNWLAFSIISALCVIFQWAVVSVFYWHMLPFMPGVHSIILGIALFPVLSLMLFLTHKMLPDTQVTQRYNPKGL